jgi:hypothetical protein
MLRKLSGSPPKFMIGKKKKKRPLVTVLRGNHITLMAGKQICRDQRLNKRQHTDMEIIYINIHIYYILFFLSDRGLRVPILSPLRMIPERLSKPLKVWDRKGEKTPKLSQTAAGWWRAMPLTWGCRGLRGGGRPLLATTKGPIAAWALQGL